MTPTWKLVCYAVASVFFVLAAVAVAVTFDTRSTRRTLTAVNWIGFGLLVFVFPFLWDAAVAAF